MRRPRALARGTLWAALALCSLAALRGDGFGTAQTFRLVVSAALPVNLDQLTWLPTDAARAIGVGRSGWPELVVDATHGRSEIELRAPGACPLAVSTRDASPDAVVGARLVPWFQVRGEDPQLGFDAPFEIGLEPQCEEAKQVRVEWQPAGVEPVRALRISEDGLVLHGRTQSFEHAHPEPIPWGVVPLSPRTRGEVALESKWHDSNTSVVRTVRVAAAARATGIPIVPPGQRLVLGGSGWRVKERAASGRAEVVAASRTLPATFEPDAVGRWVLADDTDRSLAFIVGRHAQLRLDCGRSECHARAADAATNSPMTTVLMRGLTGKLGADYTAECAIACHAVGEPGLADGGFVNVARALGYLLPRDPEPDLWSELPRSLRRLAGVGCTACHGPAAIPEAESRWAILRSDVCAFCHDAPPRYRQVEAWRSSRMATPSLVALSRERSAGCDGCHGVAGFLARIGVREFSPTRDPLGITCATCHAPHGDVAQHALIRRVTLANRWATLDPVHDAATRLCIACHSPLETDPEPKQSAAFLWFGDEKPGPHRSVPGGCVGCHMQGDTGHTFRADTAACKSCHPNGAPQESPLISARARAVWERLSALGVVPRLDAGPPHALETPALRTDERLARAGRNARLVLEDPAAWVHNGPLARSLLDEAERALKTR